MQNFRFYAPTEVIFGRDVENKTGETAAKYIMENGLCLEEFISLYK